MDTKIWTDESDNYTKRAQDINSDMFCLKNSEQHSKNIKEIIDRYTTLTENFLDVGCAFGRSINALKEIYKDSYFYGIDPGTETIDLARENIDSERVFFINGFSHDLPYEDDKFDVVIFSMVLQWLPRKYLIRTIAEVDRVLKTGGVVYIQDFLPNKPITSQSRHDNEIYIFKNDYSSFFTAFSWYKEVYRDIRSIEDGEDQQRVTSIVKKYPLDEVYTLKDGAVEKK
ncbi:MAG: class I SAM-dependent methyltransferase [Campylobacterota bacterium]|nr:class I SAM-dependent methyltransferase [Campylobacterota bacterium]